MISRSVLAACSLAAAVCLNAAAQSPNQTSSQPPAQTSSPSSAASQTAPKLQLQNLPPDPTTPTPAEIAARQQQEAVESAIRLAQVQAHWGPEMSTPGISIQLVEAGRAKAADGATQVTYRISGSGFSPNEKLTLVRWPLDAAADRVMSGIGFNAQGIAVCADEPSASGGTFPAPSLSAPAPHVAEQPAPPPAPGCAKTMQTGQPLQIQATAAAGEAIRVALVSSDRRQGAATSAVPFPIAAADHGCRLQVLLGMKDAGMVLVEGSGFPPDTGLRLSTVTGSQTRNLSSKTNAQGRTIFAVMPSAGGQTTGETTVRYDGMIRMPSLSDADKAATPNSACSPSVTFHWGQGTYKLQ